MYCGTCGAPIEEDTSFCGKCGCPIEAKPTEVSAEPECTAESLQPQGALDASDELYLEYESDFANAASMQSVALASSVAYSPDQAAYNADENPEPAGTAQAKKRPIVPIVVSLVAIIVLAALGIYAFNQIQQQAYERDHAEHQLELGISGIDLQTETPVIPVSISGTDLDGTSVNITSVVEPGITTPALIQGAYTLSFPACAIASNGNVYIAPTNSTFFSIGNELEPDEPCKVIVEQSFTQLNPIDVTDEMLESASSYIKNAPDGAQLANELMTLAIDKRTQAQEAKRIADEEAARKAAEEAERQRREQLIAQRTKITGKFFGMGMYPEAKDYVSLSVDGDVLTVTGNLQQSSANGLPSRSLGYGVRKFILTQNTKYSYHAEIQFFITKDKFMAMAIPDQFPGISIEVQDGYVTSIDFGD